MSASLAIAIELAIILCLAGIVWRETAMRRFWEDRSAFWKDDAAIWRAEVNLIGQMRHNRSVKSAATKARNRKARQDARTAELRSAANLDEVGRKIAVIRNVLHP